MITLAGTEAERALLVIARLTSCTCGLVPRYYAMNEDVRYHHDVACAVRREIAQHAVRFVSPETDMREYLRIVDETCDKDAANRASAV